MSRKLPDLKRKINFRTPKRLFKIITEGKNTEPDYFLAINKSFPGALIELEIIAAAGSPITIANRATEEKRALDRLKIKNRKSSSYLQNDEIWVAFDRDEHLKVSEAINICEKAGIGVAFSNPCFELWLILHYKDFDKPDNRHEVQKELERLCDDYDRKTGKKPNCSNLIPKVSEAETRAEKQIIRRIEENNASGPPSTTVFKLTRALRQATDLFLKN